MAARASTDLIKDFGFSTPPVLQNPNALAVHLSFVVMFYYLNKKSLLIQDDDQRLFSCNILYT